MRVSTAQVYTSAACNCNPKILDWNREGIICYGAANAVVIYNENIKGADPITVLSYHKGKVNAVKWLHKSDGKCTELLSCSEDSTAAIWTLKDGKWEVSDTLNGHRESVTCIYGLYKPNGILVVYTAGYDCFVNVWERYTDGKVNHVQQMLCLPGLCLSLHAALLPDVNQPVLFCGMDDHRITMYIEPTYHKIHAIAGHEDWVTSLDVLHVDDTTMLLASGSQDTYIRIWRIQLHVKDSQQTGIMVEQQLFEAYSKKWSVKLEAVLAGHQNWVYGVQWHPYQVVGNKRIPVYRLLSSSLDQMLIIWEPTSEGEGNDSWVEKVRVGKAGTSGFGFHGGHFSPDGSSILGHDFVGSFHVWELDKETDQWNPKVVWGGHSNTVEDVKWEPQSGRYLMSVSTDKTTRIHGPWKKGDGSEEWHELARPQTHGHDLWALAMLSATTFASGAEEKVIRVFNAPQSFVTDFATISGIQLDGENNAPWRVMVPSLGLSNKAIYSGDSETPHDEFVDAPAVISEPPPEETLSDHTLWPERAKLYGHGDEVRALAASPCGRLLASACSATSPDFAAVLLWNTSTWEQVQKLVSHSLTVTQLAFSPRGDHLLSVSRDRRWTLYERDEDSNLFKIIAGTDKTNGVHKRIIWCCAWAHDGRAFATGSRDGKVCVWANTGAVAETSLLAYAQAGATLDTGEAVTAMDFAPLQLPEARVLALGFQTGVVQLFNFLPTGNWSMLYEFDNRMAHHLKVTRLTFRPQPAAAPGQPMLLASGGADNLVRVHTVTVYR